MGLFSKKRRGLYIYFKNVRDINKLENYGNLISYSKKHKYLYVYVDEDKVEETIEILKEKKNVRKVVKSELVDLSLDFTIID